MKNYIFPLVIIMIICVSCHKEPFCKRGHGQVESREISLNNFDAIHLEGSGNVTIVEDSVQKVIVKTHPNLFSSLNTHVRDGEWIIKFNDCVNNEDLEVFITVPSMRSIRSSGAGKVSTGNILHCQDLRLSLEGSGEFSIGAIVASSISTTIDGAGKMYLTGSSASCKYSIDGSGDIKAADFPSQSIEAIINGSGKMETNVSQSLNVNISGSGTVLYKGNPAVHSNISGSGEIRSF